MNAETLCFLEPDRACPTECPFYQSTTNIISSRAQAEGINPQDFVNQKREEFISSTPDQRAGYTERHSLRLEAYQDQSLCLQFIRK